MRETERDRGEKTRLYGLSVAQRRMGRKTGRRGDASLSAGASRLEVLVLIVPRDFEDASVKAAELLKEGRAHV